MRLVLLFWAYLGTCLGEGLPSMFGGDVTTMLGKPKANCDGKSICDIYMMRFLNQLLSRTNLKDHRLGKDSGVYVPMKLYFNWTNLKVIQAYASGDVEDYQDLDRALFMLFNGPGIKEELALIDEGEKMSEEQPGYSMSLTPEFLIVCVIGSIVFISFWLVLTGVSFFKTFLLIFIIAFSIGLGLTWWQEVEEKKIEAMLHLAASNGIPEECITGQASYYRQIKSFFYGNDGMCKEYHWAQVNPMSKVIFSDVFVKTFSSMLLTPLPIAGDAVGKMTANFTKQLPWLSNIISWFVVPILSPIMFLMVFIFLVTSLLGRGTNFSLPFVSFTSHPKTKDKEKKYVKRIVREKIEPIKKHVLVQKSQSEGNFLEDRTTKYPKKVKRQLSEVSKVYVAQDVQKLKPKPRPRRTSQTKEVVFKKPPTEHESDSSYIMEKADIVYSIMTKSYLAG